ncbi:IS4 transposase (plasmid) [Halapricum desulfuricans]|uniref:IS4 transposase n=1 Tax=Halapricum desulfuricans TaxID=2841257 RepID=A0A897NL62_9EURY|nr:IS4 transposase [Halapricum desulfuricans]
MFVWTLIAGFAAGGEARSIAAYRRSYNLVTGHNLFPSSFYDRFTDGIADLLGDLLDLAVKEVAVPTTSHQPSTGSAMLSLLTPLSSDYIDSSRLFQQPTRASPASNSISFTRH